MIELVQAPDTNRVIADGNDTFIQLATTTGGDHYIRANIYINDVLFLSQGWSKDENGLCTFNLKHLYYSYFENPFSTEIVTGFRKKEDLFKKVRIVAEEFKVGSINPVFTFTLPEFHIVKNHRPQVFDDTKTVQFLHLPQENINVSRDGGFVFPLFLKAGSLLTVTITDPLGAVLYTETLENYDTQVTQYELDLKDLGLLLLDSVFVKFTTSQDEVQKKLKLINESIYPAKQVFYLNNCGFYCIAYLLGRKENEHSLSPKSYAQQDGTEVTYDVEDLKELRLNSGHGYKDITLLIHSIATSLDVRLRLEGYWERVKSETKKVPGFVDNKFIYSEALQFSRVNVANFTNEQTYAMVPKLGNITKTGDENQQLQISKNEFLAAYSSTQPATHLRVRTLPQNGKLSYQTSEGTFNLTDMTSNDPGLMPYSIPLADFIALIYQPGYLLDGAPLDTLEIQMGPEVIWSNTASLILNINDVPDANLAPNIEGSTILEIALDVDGNGSKQADLTVTDPEGDQVNIIWEVLNGAPISFSNSNIANPVLTITGGEPDVSYSVRITATDTENNLSVQKIITVKTSSFLVHTISSRYEPVDNYRRCTFHFGGGKPGAKIRVRFSLQAISSNQYAVLYHEQPNEKILYGGGSSFLEELTLDDPYTPGSTFVPVKLVNNNGNSTITLTATIESVDEPQFIDEENKSTSESL